MDVTELASVDQVVEYVDQCIVLAHNDRRLALGGQPPFGPDYLTAFRGVAAEAREHAKRTVRRQPGGVELWSKFENRSALERRRRLSTQARGKSRGILNPFNFEGAARSDLRAIATHEVEQIEAWEAAGP